MRFSDVNVHYQPMRSAFIQRGLDMSTCTQYEPEFLRGARKRHPQPFYNEYNISRLIYNTESLANRILATRVHFI